MNHIKEEILLIMDSSTISYMAKCRILLSALSDIEDWRWLQELYLKYALDQNDSIALLHVLVILLEYIRILICRVYIRSFNTYQKLALI